MIKIFVYAVFYKSGRQDYQMSTEPKPGETITLTTETLSDLARDIGEKIRKGELGTSSKDIGVNFHPPFDVIIETPREKIRALKGRPLAREEIQEFLEAFNALFKRDWPRGPKVS